MVDTQTYTWDMGLISLSAANQLRDEGLTHDQEEAMIMSDRICLMNNSRIEQIGSPADLYFSPRSVFAADFIGESNLLDAQVVAIDGTEVTLNWRGGRLAQGQTRRRSRRSLGRGCEAYGAARNVERAPTGSESR
jgi:ABC-type Fe3+/spermidine/putrescine transport system ATPase subunit